MTTALVPLDNAVSNICDKLQVNPTNQSIRSIQATIRNISIEGAISILEALGYKNDEFFLGPDRWKIQDFADEDYFPCLQGRLAKETPTVFFWGGPPSQLRFYKGTLQILLEDRILYEIVHKGAHKIAQMIGLDITSVGC